MPTLASCSFTKSHPWSSVQGSLGQPFPVGASAPALPIQLIASLAKITGGREVAGG